MLLKILRMQSLTKENIKMGLQFLLTAVVVKTNLLPTSPNIIEDIFLQNPFKQNELICPLDTSLLTKTKNQRGKLAVLL